MPDLQVDTAVLRTCGRSLRRVYDEFKAAHDTARPARDVIAHPRLRDRLEEFADGWDHRREEMVKAIEGLGESAEAAAKVYENVETELVKALEGK